MSFLPLSRHISSTGTGILQLCAGMLIIPILDVFAKLLGGRLDPVEVTLMRFIMQACLMAPFVIYLRLWKIPPNTLLIQAARGVLLAIATVCFFETSFKYKRYIEFVSNFNCSLSYLKSHFFTLNCTRSSDQEEIIRVKKFYIWCVAPKINIWYQ